MQIQENEKIFIAGASRGLGASFYQRLNQQYPKLQIMSASRKPIPESGEHFDFSKKSLWPIYLEKILAFKPNRILYFPGGGPYKNFWHNKSSDLEWCWHVTYGFSEYLIYHLLQKYVKQDSYQLEPLQIIFIGSSVAENRPDPKAAVYSAAKHALRGLVSSLQLEIRNDSDLEPRVDLRLFSPTYLQTELLPLGTWPRMQGKAQEPLFVAETLLKWMQNTSFRNSHWCCSRLAQSSELPEGQSTSYSEEELVNTDPHI